jgi:nicotinamide mononucleotide transporter
MQLSITSFLIKLIAFIKMEIIVEGFRIGLNQMSWLEAVAVIFGLLSVWFAKKENILVFPTGIVSVLIYVHICFGAKLYADMGINAYYFIMSIYGWYIWSRKGEGSIHIPISKNSIKENINTSILLVVAYFSIWYVLTNYTDSDVPQIDAFTTSVAFAAMWLMAKKKIENWMAWIVTDLVSIPLYFYKGYILTSFQYLIFLLIAIAGFIAWKKALKATHNG